MKTFIIEQNKGKLRITPISTVKNQKQVIIKDDPLMSLKELKRQISENFNVKVEEIDLLII